MAGIAKKPVTGTETMLFKEESETLYGSLHVTVLINAGVSTETFYLRRTETETLFQFCANRTSQ